MANNEFNSIEDFIDGFTKVEPTCNLSKYDGIIYGIDFLYCGKYYRITREKTGEEEKYRVIFNKDKKSFITFFEIPKNDFPDSTNIPVSNYLGIFDDVYDLIENGNINGILLKNIIADSKTKILGID